MDKQIIVYKREEPEYWYPNPPGTNIWYGDCPFEGDFQQWNKVVLYITIGNNKSDENPFELTTKYNKREYDYFSKYFYE